MSSRPNRGWNISTWADCHYNLYTCEPEQILSHWLHLRFFTLSSSLLHPMTNIERLHNRKKGGPGGAGSSTQAEQSERSLAGVGAASCRRLYALTCGGPAHKKYYRLHVIIEEKTDSTMGSVQFVACNGCILIRHPGPNQIMLIEQKKRTRGLFPVPCSYGRGK